MKKALNALNWILGIILALSALVTLSKSFIAALLLIGASALLIPPVRDIAFSATQIKIPSFLRAGLVIIAWIGAGILFSNNLSSANPDHFLSPSEAISPECLSAFSAAAKVSALRDRHEDMFPAFSACHTAKEWKAANAHYPSALDGADPITYALNVCLNYQEKLRSTPVCRALNIAPAESESTLRRASSVGISNVPLPMGSQLTKKQSGDVAQYRDPMETYSITATAPNLIDFFNREMSNDGWLKGGASNETALFFGKGGKNVIIIIDPRRGFTISSNEM